MRWPSLLLTSSLLAACGSVATTTDAHHGDGAADTTAAADAPTDAAPLGLDHQRVIYSAMGTGGISQIYSRHLDGSAPLQITHEATSALFAAVTPDGSKIVFTGGGAANEDLYVENLDGTGLRRLTTNAATDYRPAISLDGLRVAYVSTRDGGTNIYVVTLADGDAGVITRVTTGTSSHTFPSWGRGNTITYTESATMAASEIMSVNADGTGLTNLTNNPANDATSSSSRDGNKIVFSSDRSGSAPLWMMNADGSAPVQITTDATPNKYHPSFDYTGTHVVYFAGVTRNLYVANLDGTGVVQLTQDTDAVSEKLGSWVIAN
jgi:TolB protein